LKLKDIAMNCSICSTPAQVVTPEEMEAWRMKRARGNDDPLLQAAKSKADGGEKAAVGGYELL
jgi:hypothetical protein